MAIRSCRYHPSCRGGWRATLSQEEGETEVSFLDDVWVEAAYTEALVSRPHREA